jgi:UDP-GlcNAc3NAcA epimerase
VKSKTKILTVIGARPQFLKAAMVSKALAALGVLEVVVHTGQHYDADMSDIFFTELELAKPAYNLAVGSGGHGAQTGRMLESVEQVLLCERPDWVLVYGDTNSTLAGALAASKLHIKTAHVEAGLRSFNRRMPEETNRVLTDHMAELLFVPTRAGIENLAREGIAGNNVLLSGDVMFDTANYFGSKAKRQSRILEKLGLRPRHFILATVHRPENTDDRQRLMAIMQGLEAVVAAGMPVVLPLHPRTKKALSTFDLRPGNIQFTAPVGYRDMVGLESQAALIATDSGGVQKEAFFHQVPCLTLRDETEWVELLEHGWNELVPPSLGAEEICRRTLSAIGRVGDAVSLYGDGAASRIIAQALSGDAR